MNFKKILFTLILFTTLTIDSIDKSNIYEIKIFTGESLENLRSFVVNLRITIFKEYPYLYEGNVKEENAYFDWFSKLPNTAIAVAYLDAKPIGFTSGTSFVDFDEHFQGSVDIFTKAKLEAKNYYYFPEILILPEHDNDLINYRLFEALENHAKKLNYKSGCFVTEEHESHPLKPQDYKPLDYLWHLLDYTKSALIINFSWSTIQADKSSKDKKHALIYWLKKLN